MGDWSGRYKAKLIVADHAGYKFYRFDDVDEHAGDLISWTAASETLRDLIGGYDQIQDCKTGEEIGYVVVKPAMEEDGIEADIIELELFGDTVIESPPGKAE